MISPQEPGGGDQPMVKLSNLLPTWEKNIAISEYKEELVAQVTAIRERYASSENQTQCGIDDLLDALDETLSVITGAN